jgi:hypothetical protein
LVSRKPLGGVRSAQAVTTFGVGAMVALGDSSYIVSGLDTWSVDEALPIHEPRLQKWLRVRTFHAPPTSEPPSGDGVRVRRFPDKYSCPSCHDLKDYKYFGTSAAKGICATCGRALVPSRFVMACEHGHLDDFPYWAWIHKKNAPTGDRADVHELKLTSDGRTASLRSVVVSCSCGLASSMEGAFGRTALESLGVRCRGRRPWLGDGAEEKDCDARPRTLQRGASAAWFAVNRSSLSIPPWSNTLQKLVYKNYDMLVAIVAEPSGTKILETVPWVRANEFTVEDVVEAVRQCQQFSDSDEETDEPAKGLEATEPFRLEEYDPLYYGQRQTRQGDDFECTRPDDFEDIELSFRLGRSMLVKRLREVRALEAFTRVEAPSASTDRKRYAALSRGQVDWLPAIEVSGEGVFVALDLDELIKWEASHEPAKRGAAIRRSHSELLGARAKRRGEELATGASESSVSTRYVLLHTLAHALINEWSLDAGYPAAALRERLYVSNRCAGLLIYTATSDSAGSLGGVVAQGSHARLNETLRSAINRIAWCSQDPPCMESEAGGVDSLNLAACYACVMLPESSCETNNTFLDRALLIGTPDNPDTGFFRHLLANDR